MSEFKGTPGPWFWERDVLCNVDFIVGGKHHQFNHRNRDLIAAAPDLLEALQLVMAEQSGGNKSCGHSGFTCTCSYDKAKAAISKALGQ